MVRPPDLDLSGTWRAAPAADEALRIRYVDDDLDDSGWEPVPVPGHWRSVPALASSDGPVLYRTRFSSPTDMAGPSAGTAADGDDGRSFLVLDGVLAASDVWLDGAYLGDTSGYVAAHAFEVTDLLRARGEHLLAMEVWNGPVGPGRTRDLTGALGRSALTGEHHNVGGIWGAVTIARTGPIRLRHSRLRCPTASPRRAVLALRAVLDTGDPRVVTLRTSVRLAVGEDGTERPGVEPEMVVERDHPLAAGENRVEWTVTVPDPALWWPRALGGRPRYDVTLEVVVDDEVSDRRRWRTGLREVRLDDFVCHVNDERLFLKGVSLGPTRQLLAEASPAQVAEDVRLVADAGLDLVRVHGHVARPELYEAADDAGILVWQDLPIQWGVQRAAKEPARRLARAAVDRLAHHPSIAVWCAHHEPWVADPASRRNADRRDRRRLRRRAITAQVLPSWNRSVLDRSVALVLDKSDGSRPVVAHAGVWPHLPQLAGTSSHLWAGWRWGDVEALARLLRAWPRLARFVGEFGAQAPGPGAVDALAEAGPWPDLDWPAVAAATGLEAGEAFRVADPAAHDDAASWCAALQTHQAELVRSHVETLRRLKYRPTGGFTAFALAEPAPGITAALLDHERRAKPAWAAFVAACAPVVAVVDRPPDELAPGVALDLAVHVVNDLRDPVAPVRVQATATWTTAPADDGPPAVTEETRGWEGEIAADRVARVGTLHLVVPDDATALHLALRWEGPDGICGHRHHRRDVRSR